MAIDPNTLDPEEIRQLPLDRSKPFNGLTEAQLRAIGADPEVTETQRNEQNAWQAARALQEDATLVLAAQKAVEDWEMTPAEAALGLAGSGHQRAHDLFVQQWHAAEAAEAAEEAAWDAIDLDADSYLDQHNARKSVERAQLEQERDETKAQLEDARLEALRDHVDLFVSETPGAFAFRPAVESRINEKIKRSGSLPSTDEEREAMIESALKEAVVVDSTTEAMKQQVDAEWRILRKQEGARDALMTTADIANAEQHYKRERFKQLADATEIDLASLEPGPTADEQSAALAEKYRDRQERLDSRNRHVAGIAARGGSSSGDRSEGFIEDKRRYKEAMALAEANASWGADAQVKSGYGSGAAEVSRPGGYGPDGTWPDELGPAV